MEITKIKVADHEMECIQLYLRGHELMLLFNYLVVASFLWTVNIKFSTMGVYVDTLRTDHVLELNDALANLCITPRYQDNKDWFELVKIATDKESTEA